MDASAKTALRTIRECVHEGRVSLLAHFRRRMDQRGLFWPDVQAVVDSARHVHDGGLDAFGRPKWCLAGETTDGLELEIVCALDRDKDGRLIVLITVYWN
jgi:hypothetical protein